MENIDGSCFTKQQSSDESDAGGTSKLSAKPIIARMPTDVNATHYNMNHKNRGKAVIFNHEYFGFSVAGEKVRERKGTNVDADSMAVNLSRLGFDVMVYRDLQYNNIMQLVNSAAKFDHTDCDCFVMVVLSHGDENVLYAYDQIYEIDDLWTPFAADLCTTLAGKPKLFFIQACRGSNLMAPVILRRTETDGPTNYIIPSQADFLFAYSNIPGYYSWRNINRGSWFIEALCKELKENAYKYDLVQLLAFVTRRVAIDYESNTPNEPEMHKRKQVPSVDTRLTRLLQFNRKGENYVNVVGQQKRNAKELTNCSGNNKVYLDY